MVTSRQTLAPSLFRFMHWNCNSIPAHEFERIPILEAYAAQENLNLIAITESALKDSMLDEKIEINGYSILRNNLPINDRCGGIILYYKNDISVKKIGLISPFLTLSLPKYQF